MNPKPSQHLIQFILALIVLIVDTEQCAANPSKGWLQSAWQFALGMWIMDTYQVPPAGYGLIQIIAIELSSCMLLETLS